MTPAAVLRIALVTLPVAACTTPPVAPGRPRVVERLVIAPYAMHEDCLRMSRGDRLDWRYESSAPLAFDLRYREGDAVLSPIVRERSSADSGTFEALLPRDYCAMWEAGPAGAIIGYRMELRAASP